MSRIARTAKSLLSAGRKLMSHTAGAAKSLLSKKGAGFIIGAVAVLFLLVLGIILLARDGDGHTTPQGRQPITTRGAWGPPREVKTYMVGTSWTEVKLDQRPMHISSKGDNDRLALEYAGETYRTRGTSWVWTPSLPEVVRGTVKMRSESGGSIWVEVRTW